jgi:hypothetical protein
MLLLFLQDSSTRYPHGATRRTGLDARDEVSVFTECEGGTSNALDEIKVE